jgi:transposase InsO family protein
MPWKETRVVDERVRFIAAVTEDPKGNFSRLCARFGIRRQTGYKWLERYRALGPAGLDDQRPIARSCPHKTADAVISRILELRKEHPFDGPKKLRARLLALKEPGVVVPAASTIGELLDRFGLVRPRRARLRVPPHPSPLEPCSEPNEVWCTDFKGDFLLGDRTRCYPLTITDGASRFLIKCEGLTHPDEESARPHFERAFREFGLPKRIRSDNGSPFASKALGGLSRLSVWWIQLGVLPERIEPGHPEQNGRHERMHRTLKEQTATPPHPTLADQQRAFDRFRRDYNESRPHEALGQTPPAQHYEPSWRPMPEQPRTPEYDERFTVRRVTEKGQLKCKGVNLSIGKLLAGQPIGLLPIDEEEWELHYGPLHIGYLVTRDGKPHIEPID